MQYTYCLRKLVPSLDLSPADFLSQLSQNFFPDQRLVLADDRFLEKMVVSLALDGSSSEEGIQAVIRNTLNRHISIGKISEILNHAADEAAKFDSSIDLSGIKQGANDEIFQCGMPVLTGVDAESTYTYLLKPVQNRTAEVWSSTLEECKTRHLNLEVTISDFGSGLLAGIPKAFPEIKFQGDLFHWLVELGKEISSMERKLYGKVTEYYEKMDALSGQRIHEKTFQRLCILEEQIHAETEAYDELSVLYQWLREMTDPQGYSYQDVVEICIWILKEMTRISIDRKNFQNVLKKTRSHLEHVLYFLKRSEELLRSYALERGYPEDSLLLIYRLQRYPSDSIESRSILRRLRHTLKSHFESAFLAVDAILSHVKRASSMVENLNGRLRKYMNLKRIVPDKFLTLLKVYINTKPYRRSRVKDRVGKSPYEIMTGQKPPDFYDIVLSG